MDNKRIADIGEVHWHDGQPYFLFGHSGNGFIFKDYDAYKNDWDAPCYVPEYAGEDAAVTVDDVEYECGGSRDKCDWYSHKDLLKMCRYNHKVCDNLFDTIDWCYPMSWIEDHYNHDVIDFNYAYDFVAIGNIVYWESTDDSRAPGYYKVMSIDHNDEPWTDATLVSIANKYVQMQVPLVELLSDAPSKLLTQ